MSDRDNKVKKPARRRSKDAGGEPLAVVGVGVCAASLPSLVALFGEITDNLGAAYVVAVRQQDGLTPSAVVDGWSR